MNKFKSITSLDNLSKLLGDIRPHFMEEMSKDIKEKLEYKDNISNMQNVYDAISNYHPSVINRDFAEIFELEGNKKELEKEDVNYTKFVYAEGAFFIVIRNFLYKKTDNNFEKILKISDDSSFTCFGLAIKEEHLYIYSKGLVSVYDKKNNRILKEIKIPNTLVLYGENIFYSKKMDKFIVVVKKEEGSFIIKINPNTFEFNEYLVSDNMADYGGDFIFFKKNEDIFLKILYITNKSDAIIYDLQTNTESRIKIRPFDYYPCLSVNTANSTSFSDIDYILVFKDNYHNHYEYWGVKLNEKNIQLENYYNFKKNELSTADIGNAFSMELNTRDYERRYKEEYPNIPPKENEKYIKNSEIVQGKIKNQKYFSENKNVEIITIGNNGYAHQKNSDLVKGGRKWLVYSTFNNCILYDNNRNPLYSLSIMFSSKDKPYIVFTNLNKEHIFDMFY